MTTHAKLDQTIVLLCAAFISILLLSGYFEREVLLLHVMTYFIAIIAVFWPQFLHH